MTLQSWCARCQFPGKEVFLFGCVNVDKRDGEQAARVAIVAELDTVFPTRPEILLMLPGYIMFVPE